MAVLEVRSTTGIVFKELSAEGYVLAKSWQKIDCGCAAYAANRKLMRPQLDKLIKDSPLAKLPIPAHVEKIKVLA
jgi:hypothetical protein